MQNAKPANRPAPEWDINEARRIVLSRLQGYSVDVFLFGSAATGTMRRGSDIDIAVMPKKPLPPEMVAEIREALEESDILYRVDLVDLSAAPEHLRAKVFEQGRQWND